MGMKGLGYLKTEWSFQERPVSSLKLNTWDDRIEDAVALVFQYLNWGLGNTSGVLRVNGSELRVQATATPGMSVQVLAGSALINGFPYRLTATTETASVLKPLSQSRIDLVQASLTSWTVSIKRGTESPLPLMPATDTDCVALAKLVLRPTMSVVQDTDDGTNGHIVDLRAFL